jgi:hypothetical protein
MSYTLYAERQPAGQLTIGYSNKEHALAAAEVIGLVWKSITITGPDGSLVLKLESSVPEGLALAAGSAPPQ